MNIKLTFKRMAIIEAYYWHALDNGLHETVARIERYFTPNPMHRMANDVRDHYNALTAKFYDEMEGVEISV